MKENKQVALVSFGLTAYELALLSRATEIIGNGNPRPQEKLCLVRWAVVAVCHAVIKGGKLVTPLAVDMRPETPAEKNARLVGVMAQEKNKAIPSYIAKVPGFLLQPEWQQNMDRALVIKRFKGKAVAL